MTDEELDIAVMAKIKDIFEGDVDMDVINYWTISKLEDFEIRPTEDVAYELSEYEIEMNKLINKTEEEYRYVRPKLRKSLWQVWKRFQEKTVKTIDSGAFYPALYGLLYYEDEEVA